jgi:hypothetical protein
MKPLFMKSLKIFLILFLSIFLFVVINHGVTAFAQEQSIWPPQQQIPGYLGDTNPPILIAEPNSKVHAFAYQQMGAGGQEIAIIYNQWSLDQGWTLPVDILLSPLKQSARLLDVFEDKTGMMNLIFFGGDNTDANIYYSKGPAKEANLVSAWSNPELIGDGALNPQNGAIASDGNGNLVVVFSGYQFGNGIYAVYSNDAGETWTSPTPIFLTGNNQLFPSDSKLYFDPAGYFYTVWSVYDTNGHGVAVYFSRLNSGSLQWGNIQTIATGTGLGTDLPDIIVYNGQVVMTYYNSNANTQWMVRSKDYGQTWTQPIQLSSMIIGRNGAASMVIDSNNILHSFFGGRIPGNPDIHGMWHSVWKGNYWSTPEAIISGPRVVDLTGDQGFDPTAPIAVVSQGNILLVTWRSDYGLKGNGVWYSYEKLDSPAITEESPTSPLSSTAGPTETNPPESTPTPANINTPTADIGKNPYKFENLNLNLSIGLGTGPVLILLIIIIGIQLKKRS